ncbi:MAG TPA: RIP metalloprotease RseP [Bacilli bacterium]|nr:RIP metalloprotease RseP [Bacilli bacterium]
MDFIIGLIAFIFVLGVIILIHEGGHFFFARRVNILCREFAFGMGPILWKKKKGETLYSIRAFPIGGFCAIAGEEQENDPFKNRETVKLDIKDGKIVSFYFDVDDDKVDYPIYKIISYDIFDAEETGTLFMEVVDGDFITKYPVDPQAMIHEKKTEYQIAPYNRTINSKTKRARAMVMFGGPLMNFLLALVVFFLAGLMQGYANYESSVIDNMTEETPAYVAGLRDGDEIIRLESGLLGKDITVWNDISVFMDDYQTLGALGLIRVTYLRGGSEKLTTLTPAVYVYNGGFIGDFTITDKVVVLVTSPVENNLANNIELQEGDQIIEIAGETVTSWGDVYHVFEKYVGDGDDETNWIKLKVIREGEIKQIKIKPFSKTLLEKQTTTTGEPIPAVKVAIGISPTYKFSFLKSFSYSGERTLSSFTAIIDTFALLFSGDVGVQNLSGPVGIFSLTKNVAAQGIAPIFNLIGLLSVNIGLLNLLPIPALDGGRLVFLGYEAITRKKPNQKVETILITVTMLLLFGLMIYVTFGDILRLLGIRG